MSFTSPFFPPLVLAALLAWWALPFRPAKAVLCVLNLVFYAYWFPPLVSLLVISGLIDYVAGRRIHDAADSGSRKRWLLVSLLVNLGLLGYFKYAQFFVDSVAAGLGAMGVQIERPYLGVLLPMGISFYTFQSMSYTIDIYRREMRPADSFLDFFLYLAFFPQLVAGPIVRAAHFIPQLAGRVPVGADDVFVGLFRIARGFFLKVVIADNVAGGVEQAFGSSAPEGLFVAWFGILLFAIQIFCDFAGYSEIAIGLARLFGLRIPENFLNPYSATSVQDFWRRWHISLSTWFRDYVYIPLGGGRTGQWLVLRNTLIVFLVSGLWHGANWTFVVWGGLHGTALVVERRIRRVSQPSSLLGVLFASTVLSRAAVLVFVLFAWVAFRAPDIGYTVEYWRSMVVGVPDPALLSAFNRGLFAWAFVFLVWQVIAVVTEGRSIRPTWIRQAEMAVYVSAVLLASGPATDFIYFQF